MKRTVYYIEGKNKLHRSVKCAQNTNWYGDLDLKSISIPENEYDVSNYCRKFLQFASVCLRCWDCEEDKGK